MKATAYVLEAYKQPLVMRDIEIPPLAPGEVLVKLKAAGICGSDLHMWRGDDERLHLPMILGHEGIGAVAELSGPRTTVDGSELRIGDLIFRNRGVSCGGCYYCTVIKEPALCQKRIVPGINTAANQPPYLNGCYADHLILRAGTDIFKAPADIDPAILVAASCSGATTAHGFDLAGPAIGDTVVILGPGSMGLFAAAFARAYGAGQVVLIGGSPQRLTLSQHFGVTTLLNRNETTVAERNETVLNLTSGRGADMVIEASGSGAALEEGIGLARIGGTVLSIGMSQPGGTFVFDGFRDLTRKNLRLQGVWVSDTRHVLQAVDLVRQHPETFSRLVTHRFPLNKVNEALQTLQNKEAIKIVLIPD